MVMVSWSSVFSRITDRAVWDILIVMMMMIIIITITTTKNTVSLYCVSKHPMAFIYTL
jgi:hypothetical protein